MQTVPSLVGTGTAIAAAATGLVFGQSVDQNHEPDYDTPISARRGARGHKRTTSVDRALPTKSASSSRISAPPSRRPATSSVGSHSIGHEAQTVADSTDQISRPPLSRRQRPRDLLGSSSSTPSRCPPPVGDQGISAPNVVVVQAAKEPSTSSNSWFKRLSIRPLSQHGSPRSSILAESTSFPISHGSRAPLPSRSGSVSKPLPPNKLVKRSSPERNKHLEEAISRKPKGRLPSLRRPATSHQRSAALQQFRADIDVAGSSPHPKYSFDEPIRPEELLGASPIEDPDQSARTRSATGKLGWASFFHSRSGEIETNPSSPGRAGSSGDAASRGKGLNSKRIHPEKGSSHSAGAHLVKPRMVSSNPSTVGASLASSHIEEEDADGTAKRQRERMDSPPQSEMASEVARPAQPRRSFSSSFSHAANWASQNPGSLRRTKRGAAQGEGEGRSEGRSEGNSEASSDSRRHVSAPVRGAHSAAGRVGSTTKPPVALILHGSALDSAATSPRPAPKRNASSPLPPLSNLAGAHAHAHAHAHANANANALADSSRRLQVVVSPAPGGASFPMRPSQPSGSSTSSASAAMSQRRGGSPDGDARDFNSGDEDDTDLKSDTLFDSVRTAGSGRVRAVETPLESVYDESPPSTGGGGNKKSKRLSIQEILERTWNEDCRIMEEDETSATPVRVAQRPALDQQPRRERKEDPRWFALEPSSSPPNAHQLTHDVGRFSLDDDFDEDWTRDEHDAPFKALSPPSKGNSLNASSANINPNVCLALASIGANSVTPPPPPKSGLSHTERTLGNLFDWSEPLAHDKQNPTGGALRPQTAYGKQLGDSRGGRSVVRKGPMPMHVRSQSVPVVHEGTDDSKPMGSKYGTWGLGTKTVSEDWDEDFEFGGDNNGPDGKENQDPFAVPESIRASQPSVKAHSGQIRELSLLVNDLKRLCRHGGELNMLNGDQKAVWKEAEGIIALASPDEDRVVHDDDRSGSSVYMDAFEVNGSPAEEKHVDVPFEMLDAVMDCNAPAMSKTAVVRERQSPRRRSVFSPDDDIFGANWPLTDERPRSNRPSRPRTPENQPAKTQDVNVVVRSVVETMQQNRSVMPVTELRGTQETRKSYNATNRMQFDTNSLKALVKRAGELRDVLSDMIRKADQLTQSPIRTPRHERRLDSSPAFTRVFDDPGSSPPRRPAKTRGSSSTLVEQRPSPDNSPPSNMSRRVPLMTVI